MSETLLHDSESPNGFMKAPSGDEDSKFLRSAGSRALALGVTAGLVVTGAAIAAGNGAEAAKTPRPETGSEEVASRPAFDKIYPVKSVIGEVVIPVDGSIQGEVERFLGPNTHTSDYNYGLFLDSAKALGVAQPGDTFSIVKVGPDDDTRKNIIVVKPTQIDHGPADSLPTPITH